MSSPTTMAAKQDKDKDKEETTLICPLCAGEMKESYNGRDAPDPDDNYRRRRRFLAVPRACCSQEGQQQQQQQKVCCQSCLYRHIHSILEEGLAGGGDGRTSLTCPLGCSAEISDAEVRSCFHREHVNVFWNGIIGPCIIYPLCLVFILLFPSFNHNHFLHNEDDFAVRRHFYWTYCCTTRAERADLRQYERWSLCMAFRQMMNNAPTTMHCPAPNCDYTWIVANPAHRKYKIAHERKKTYLWYSPPKPEKYKAKKDKDDDDFDDWCRPEFLNMSSSRAYHQTRNAENNNGGGNNNNIDDIFEFSGSRDGRYMCCAKCHTLFCGLCRQPWRFGSKCHEGIACRAYRRQLPAALQQEGEAYAFSGNNNGNNTRCCPGCSMATSRTGGCNHMTCRCGVEWCYVCEKPWTSSWHYGCVLDARPAANTSGCIIS